MLFYLRFTGTLSMGCWGMPETLVSDLIDHNVLHYLWTLCTTPSWKIDNVKHLLLAYIHRSEFRQLPTSFTCHRGWHTLKSLFYISSMPFTDKKRKNRLRRKAEIQKKFKASSNLTWRKWKSPWNVLTTGTPSPHFPSRRSNEKMSQFHFLSTWASLVSALNLVFLWILFTLLLSAWCRHENFNILFIGTQNVKKPLIILP